MKKIIAAFFFLLCGTLVLLATIDLAPYFPVDRGTMAEKIASSPAAKTAEPPGKFEPAGTTEGPSTELSVPAPQNLLQPGEAQQDESEPAMAADALPTGQEQPATPPAAGEETADGSKPEQAPASPVELEVTVLPAGEYPFSVLLDTFIEQASAQQAILHHQQRGISAHWVKVALGEYGVRYRVFTGAFSSLADAQQFLDDNHLIDKPIKQTVYAARIGVYRDKARLADDYLKAGDGGAMPYVLGTEDGQYFLYVGAFYTYLGATDQCGELAAAGLNCEPVKRSTLPSQ